ncbi:C2 domain-containing protein, partial [Thraustotheca clavata]
MSHILKVELLKAADLPIADIALLGGKSDPYVIFALGDQEHRSPCVAANLNPIWSNETFQLRVPDLKDTLRLEIWDHDNLRPDDLLGLVHIPLSTIPRGLDNTNEPVSYPMELDSQFRNQHVKSQIFLILQLLTPEEAVAKLEFEVWENERWSLRHGWSKDNLGSSERKPWSSRDGLESSSLFEKAIPVIPVNYKATDTWHYVKHIGDRDGWIYAPSF